jgi:hypothetical protein
MMMKIGTKFAVSLAAICALWIGDVAAHQTTQAASVGSPHQPASARACCQHTDCKCGM